MNHPSRRDFIRTAVAAAAGLSLHGHPVFSAAVQKKRRPNILLLFPDQHRFDFIGANRALPMRTPNLDELARRGSCLTNATCPSPLCAPSRACLASGKDYDRCGVPDNKTGYPLDRSTFYRLLRESGYHVSGFGKFDLHKGFDTWGVDGRHLLSEWGFSSGMDSAGKWDAISSYRRGNTPKDPYMFYLQQKSLVETHVTDYLKRQGRKELVAVFPTPLPEEAYCDNWIAANALKRMQQFPKDRPWFLMVSFAGPHNPWDITTRMDGICRDRTFPPPNGNTEFPAERLQAVRQNYAAMVENIDRWLGLFIDGLKARNELDDTMIVWSSDHGEMLGDHNLWHKSVPYRPSVGVPFVAAGPGMRSGWSSPALVSTMDLAATFLDVACIPVPSDMDSRSLKSLLTGQTDSHREFVRSGLGQWRMVFDGRYKLIRGYAAPDETRDGVAGDGRNRGGLFLFDLDSDPMENENVAEKHPRIVDRLVRCL